MNWLSGSDAIPNPFTASVSQLIQALKFNQGIFPVLHASPKLFSGNIGTPQRTWDIQVYLTVHPVFILCVCTHV